MWTKITSTQVKHNNSARNIVTFSQTTAPSFVWTPGMPSYIFYDNPRNSGGKFFSLQSFNTVYLVDLDEYWFHDTSATATQWFKLVTVYITKRLNGANVDIVMVVNTNPEYTNGSAEINIDYKEYMLI